MIPFFRKIRYKLAANNQFFKYSRYAIGEIVLVVIGILIALYINNWNEERKKRQEFDQALVEVEKELIVNIKNSRLGLDYLFQQDSLTKRILFDTVSYIDFERSYNLRHLIEYDGDPALVFDNAYKKLLELDAKLNEEQDSIVSNLMRVYSIRDYISKNYDDRKNFTTRMLQSYEKYSWFNDWRLFRAPPERIDYQLNDPQFKTDLITYSNLNLGHLRFAAERIDIDSRIAYQMIYDYLESKNIRHIDSLHFQYDAHDFEHYVGTYVQTWESYDYRDADSTVISIEEDKLFYTPYYPDGTNSKREIIPVSKYNFRTENGWGLYRIIFDNEDNVLGTSHSAGMTKDISKKIR